MAHSAHICRNWSTYVLLFHFRDIQTELTFEHCTHMTRTKFDPLFLVKEPELYAFISNEPLSTSATDAASLGRRLLSAKELLFFNIFALIGDNAESLA